jgi:hypothetical protein
MDNPFVYGEVVPSGAFADRELELDRLVADLAAGQKVFLISPRRYGKSSLIRQALSTLSRRGLLTIEVTVSAYSSYVAFLEGYARALAASESRWQRAREWLSAAITSTRPEIRLEQSATGPGRFAVAFPLVRTERDITRLANELFALPGRIAADRRRPVVVALDEFQAIDAFNGGSVEHALRAAAQHQRQVGYVFAGSEPSLMEKMIGPKRPFYKAGPVMRLDRTSSPSSSTRGSPAAASGPRRDLARPSSSSRATCRTTCSVWRTKRGTMCAPAARDGPRWTACTRRWPGCCRSRTRCSKPSGSG